MVLQSLTHLEYRVIVCLSPSLFSDPGFRHVFLHKHSMHAASSFHQSEGFPIWDRRLGGESNREIDFGFGSCVRARALDVESERASNFRQATFLFPFSSQVLFFCALGKPWSPRQSE